MGLSFVCNVPSMDTWLRIRDSDPNYNSQSVVCYHYTNPQYCRSVPGCHNCGYIILIAYGAPERIRTSDLTLKRRELYR